MTIGTQQAQIEALYIGYFNRSSEPAGLAYWVGQLDSGMPLAQIAESFSVQPEATALYPFLANPAAGGIASFLGAVYANLYNRPIDAAGVAYWTAQIDGGRTIGPIILDLTSGAQGDDALTLANKAAVGLAYAHMFDSARETWTTADRWSAHDVVAGVTFDPATVTAAEAKIMGLFAPTPTPTPAPPPTPTSTPTPTPMPGPTPTSTAMDLTNAGNSVALAGTIGAISLTGADLATYPADAFGTVALALASGKLWVVSTAGGTLSAAANSAATSYHFGTGVVGGADAIDSKMTYQGFNSYIASPNGDTVTLTATGQNVTGGAGADTINGGPGTHAVSGGGGVDTFNVTAGTVAISDVGNGGADVLAVSAGATANATLAGAWTATAATSNNGTASVNAAGFTLNVASATGVNGWTLTNSGGAATLTGSANNDSITGGSGADTLVGGGGNDVLTGGAQNDSMTGGAGIDTFNVDAGSDTVTDLGVGGADNLVVSAGATASATLTGAWTASGSSANAGTANVNAAGNTLSVAAAIGANGWTLTNSGGGAALTGSSKADTINGGTGNDTLVGNGGNDTLTGGAATDSFIVDAGTDTITDLGNGGSNESVKVSAGATLNATLFSAWAPSFARASNEGTASIEVAGHQITLIDALGANGWTLTNGSSSGAAVAGSKKDDTIIGGSGNDRILGSGGNDTFTGGAGADWFSVNNSGTASITDLGNGSDDLRVASGTANATLVAAWTATSFSFNEGTANVDAAGFNLDLSAVTGSDGWTVTNSGGAASLTGSVLADNLSGGTGNDTLAGNAGNDSLTGGGGADGMTGGSGNDTFVFASRPDTRSASFASSDTNADNVDKITDFVGNSAAAGDVIRFGTGAGAFGAGIQFSGATTVTIVSHSFGATADDFRDLASIADAVLGVSSTSSTARLYHLTFTEGSLSGDWLILNDNFHSITTDDTFINITGITGTLNAADFQFA